MSNSEYWGTMTSINRKIVPRTVWVITPKDDNGHNMQDILTGKTDHLGWRGTCERTDPITEQEVIRFLNEELTKITNQIAGLMVARDKISDTIDGIIND